MCRQPILIVFLVFIYVLFTWMGHNTNTIIFYKIMKCKVMSHEEYKIIFSFNKSIVIVPTLKIAIQMYLNFASKLDGIQTKSFKCV